MADTARLRFVDHLSFAGGNQLWSLHPRGPVFHAWLPDGRRDAIVLDRPAEAYTLQLWFERRGYADARGFVVYDNARREVDVAVLRRQALADGGLLFGEVTLGQVPSDQMRALFEKQVGTPAYEAPLSAVPVTLLRRRHVRN